MGWFSILQAALGFVTGPLTRIAEQITQLKTQQSNADSEQERIAVGERVKVLEAQRDVLIAEAGSRINSWVRLFFVIPVAIYVWKLIIWDKVIGSLLGRDFSTDDLSDNLWWIVFAVIGFYFVQNIATILKRPGRS